eukprot:420290-Pelagomonas_calceolata.AAC.2
MDTRVSVTDFTKRMIAWKRNLVQAYKPALAHHPAPLFMGADKCGGPACGAHQARGAGALGCSFAVIAPFAWLILGGLNRAPQAGRDGVLGKEKKYYVGRGGSPYINQGKGNALAQKSRESPPPRMCARLNVNGCHFMS